MTLKQCLQYLIDQGYNYIAFTPAQDKRLWQQEKRMGIKDRVGHYIVSDNCPTVFRVGYGGFCEYRNCNKVRIVDSIEELWGGNYTDGINPIEISSIFKYLEPQDIEKLPWEK